MASASRHRRRYMPDVASATGQEVPWDTGIMPRGLFEHDVPPGFHYRADFITGDDEQVLLNAIGGDVAFSDFEMRGVVARRRVAFFGQSYDRATAGPFPAFLLSLCAKIAQWAGVDAEAFAMALINEYRTGSPIGWHRDAPLRHRCRRLAAVGLPDEIPPVLVGLMSSVLEVCPCLSLVSVGTLSAGRS
jgi:hypothetical protein